MKYLLQEDECSPDSHETFVRELKDKFYLTISDFQEKGKRIEFGYELGGLKIEYFPEEPWWHLSLVEKPGDIPLENVELIYKKALEKWGKRVQLEMAQEEATELALAIRRHIRTPYGGTFVNLVDEVADMEIRSSSSIIPFTLFYTKSSELTIQTIRTHRSTRPPRRFSTTPRRRSGH